MNDPLEKIAVITGASRGIGHATACLFLERGWRIITCSRDQISVDRKRYPNWIIHISSDLTNPSSIDEFIEKVNSVIEAVRDISLGGAHVSIDALGHPITCSNSIQCLRKRGKHIQVGLMLGSERSPYVPMEKIVAYELEILGSHGMQSHRYPELLSMIEKGHLQPSKLIGKTITLEDALIELPAMNEFAGVGVTVVDKF